MSGFSWNVRGLNKSSKHSIIHDWIRCNPFYFGCFLETRVKESKSSTIAHSIAPHWSVISNYEHSRLGRIWVVWGDKARLTPVDKSHQIITCSILLEDKEEEFFCSFIYASNFADERNYGMTFVITMAHR